MAKTVLLIDSATKLIVAETNPPGDLTTIEELQGQGFTTHSASHQWACRVLQAPASGMTIANPDGTAGDPTFAFTGELASLLAISSAGIMARDATGTWFGRTLTGTANQISIDHPDGATGNPTFSLPQDIATTSSVTFADLTLTGHTGIQKAVGGLLTGAVAGTDYIAATTGSAIQKANGAGGLTAATANADFLPGTTGSAIQKASAGGLTAATSGVDYAPATFTGATGSLLKNDLSGGFTAATANADFLPGTTGSAIQKASAGGLTGAVANTDYLSPIGPIVSNVVGAEYITVTKNRDFSAAPDWAGTNWVRPATGTLTDVSVTGTNNYHRVAGSFITDGFQVGMTVVWTGFVSGSNNGSFVIQTLTATDMTVTVSTLTNVAAGASVSGVSNVWAHTVAGANATNLPSANLTATPATGVVYQLTYDIVTGVTGTFIPSIGGGSGQTLGTAIGTVTANVETVTAAGTADLTFTPSAVWVGWIDNLSLKVVTPASLTNQQQTFASSGMTISTSGQLSSAVSKFTWTNAMVAALGATPTASLRVCTLPARTIIKSAYLVLDSAATAAGTLSGSIGIVGATYIDILIASDLKAAANTVYGSVSGDRGTNLTGYKFNSVTAPTDVFMYFSSGSGNLSTITTCTGTIYLETVTLP